MNGSAAGEDWLAGGSLALVRYPSMLTATVAGQLVGIAIDAAIGTHSPWIPLALSVVLEALAGARAGASRPGGVLDSAQAGRVSLTYSLGLVLLSVPLVVWIAASHRASADGGVGLSVWTPAHLAVAAAALLIATAVRWRLMILFSPRRQR